MRAWERRNLTRRIDKKIRIRKEPNINMVNHQISKINKGRRTEHRISKTTRRKKKTTKKKNDRYKHILFNNNPECK